MTDQSSPFYLYVALPFRYRGLKNRATPLAAEGGARSAGVGGIVPTPYIADNLY